MPLPICSGQFGLSHSIVTVSSSWFSMASMRYFADTPISDGSPVWLAPLMTALLSRPSMTKQSSSSFSFTLTNLSPSAEAIALAARMADIRSGLLAVSVAGVVWRGRLLRQSGYWLSTSWVL